MSNDNRSLSLPVGAGGLNLDRGVEMKTEKEKMLQGDLYDASLKKYLLHADLWGSFGSVAGYRARGTL